MRIKDYQKGLNDFQKEQVKKILKEEIEKMEKRILRQGYPNKEELKTLKIGGTD